MSGKIGIGITTRNRKDVFIKTLTQVLKHWAGNQEICVVEDAGDKPYASSWMDQDMCPGYHYTFKQNVGIARAKNKCIELLMDAGCEHIFLFDDDTYPVKDDWWKPYVESPEPHLMYIFTDFVKQKLNDTALVYRDDNKVAYNHPRGCMLYYHRSCFEKVGGMWPGFGTWGYEHGDLSNRIFNAGLTSFRYMDVPDSAQYFYSGDEHQAVRSTVPPGPARWQMIRQNKPLADARFNSCEYVEYREKKDIVLSCYFTGVADPQRGNKKWVNDTDGLFTMIESCLRNKIAPVILYDNRFTDYELPGVNQVCVKTSINPYFQRWISYAEYLSANRHNINRVWCVDATDVEMLKNPFPHMRDGVLYCGEEPDTFNNIWMTRHHTSEPFQQEVKKYPNDPLLNAGVLGGPIERVIEVCRKIADYYANNLNKDMTDMAAFNMVLRPMNPQHGLFVTTPFKSNTKNSLSWFRHK